MFGGTVGNFGVDVSGSGMIMTLVTAIIVRCLWN